MPDALELQEEIGAWHRGRWGGMGDPCRIFAKLCAEVGELGDAILLATADDPTISTGKGLVPDEIGDVLIAAMGIAEAFGVDALAAARSKFERVQRKHPVRAGAHDA